MFEVSPIMAGVEAGMEGGARERAGELFFDLLGDVDRLVQEASGSKSFDVFVGFDLVESNKFIFRDR